MRRSRFDDDFRPRGHQAGDDDRRRGGATLRRDSPHGLMGDKPIPPGLLGDGPMGFHKKSPILASPDESHNLRDTRRHPDSWKPSLLGPHPTNSPVRNKPPLAEERRQIHGHSPFAQKRGPSHLDSEIDEHMHPESFPDFPPAKRGRPGPQEEGRRSLLQEPVSSGDFFEKPSLRFLQQRRKALLDELREVEEQISTFENNVRNPPERVVEFHERGENSNATDHKRRALLEIPGIEHEIRHEIRNAIRNALLPRGEPPLNFARKPLLQNPDVNHQADRFTEEEFFEPQDNRPPRNDFDRNQRRVDNSRFGRNDNLNHRDGHFDDQPTRSPPPQQRRGILGSPPRELMGGYNRPPGNSFHPNRGEDGPNQRRGFQDREFRPDRPPTRRNPRDPANC